MFCVQWVHMHVTQAPGMFVQWHDWIWSPILPIMPCHAIPCMARGIILESDPNCAVNICQDRGNWDYRYYSSPHPAALTQGVCKIRPVGQVQFAKEFYLDCSRSPSSVGPGMGVQLSHCACSWSYHPRQPGKRQCSYGTQLPSSSSFWLLILASPLLPAQPHCQGTPASLSCPQPWGHQTDRQGLHEDQPGPL